jgi:hypothetical protein
MRLEDYLMDNEILKKLIDRIDTICLEKADAVVIHYNMYNLNEAMYLQRVLMTSKLFDKYAKRGIGVVLIPDDLKLEIKTGEVGT